MVERAYTVAEIDRMRSALFAWLEPFGQPYSAREFEQTIELRLRTYLEAGISPDDLDAHIRSMEDG